MNGLGLFAIWSGRYYEWDVLTKVEQQRWNNLALQREAELAQLRAALLTSQTDCRKFEDAAKANEQQAEQLRAALESSAREIERLNIVNSALDESTENDALRARVAELEEDEKRLDWLEKTVTGKGASSFLKSIFIAHDFNGDIQLDVKTETVVIKPTLRLAIDAAHQQP